MSSRRCNIAEEAYAEAESRLLNCFSPGAPDAADVAEHHQQMGPGRNRSQALNIEDPSQFDPAVHSCLHIISDNSDIHSLISSPESSCDFKGFKNYSDQLPITGELGDIYGICRRKPQKDQATTALPSTCAEVEQLTHLGLHNNVLNTVLPEANCGDVEMEIVDHPDELIINDMEQLEQQQQDSSIIYNVGRENEVVIVSDDRCCNIIGDSGQLHNVGAILIAADGGNTMVQIIPEQLNGESVYIQEIIDIESNEVVEQQEVETLELEDAEEDHKGQVLLASENDDNNVQMPTEQIPMPEPISIDSDTTEEQQKLDEKPNVISGFANQQAVHSSTTKFPMSSTSLANGSDYDDYDDEPTEEQLSPKASHVVATSPKCKRTPLLKNTLCAEALERKLANLSQAQQMTLTEKIENWQCSSNCDVVEDVEDFGSLVEDRELKESFEEFFNKISSKLQGTGQNVFMSEDVQQQASPEVLDFNSQRLEQAAADILQRRCKDKPQHSRSSELTLSKNKLICQSIKRLLNKVEHVKTDTEDKNELDGNNGLKERHDKRYIEVIDGQERLHLPFETQHLAANSSITTLVPKEEVARRMKTTETQTSLKPLPEQDVNPILTNKSVLKCTECKETSTTDLNHHMTPDPATLKETNDAQIADALCRTMRQQAEEQPNLNMNATNSNAMFYEQHEFCNYLGLTELSTANAVASKMRELASSTMARRSLRVRSQQQLERMRNGVRGKRYVERQQQHQPDQQKHMPIKEEADITEQHMEDSSSNESSHQNEESELLHGTSTSEELAVARGQLNIKNTNPLSPMQLLHEEAPGYDYNYYTEQPQNLIEQQHQQQPRHQSPDEQFAGLPSLEARFAQVYRAAAPAQLHQDIQHRLKEAREIKPSIYIVQALTHTKKAVTPDERTVTLQEPPPTITSLAKRKQSHPQPQRNNKTAKSKLRRRATHTAGTNLSKTAASQGFVRELVTRSTTHMNSKLLRNRKISLLKSYALPDTPQQMQSNSRSNKRLSGGATSSRQARTAKVKSTPKKTTDKSSVMPNAPKLIPSVAQAQRNVHIVDLAEDAHLALEQQLRVVAQTTSPRKSRKAHGKQVSNAIGGGPATAARAQLRQESKSPTKKTVQPIRRRRVKSLPVPAASSIEPKRLEPDLVAPLEALTPSMPASPSSPPKRRLDLKYAPDTHDFITNQGIVYPPPQTAASRRLLQSSRKVAEQKLNSDNWLGSALTSASASLPQPALVYPQASKILPLHERERLHFSRRRETAGTATLNDPLRGMPDIKHAPPGGLLRLTIGSPTLRNPLVGKHGKVLYMYYELDQLIVLQEKIITFWKYSKVLNLLHKQAGATVETQRTNNNNTADSEHSYGGGGTEPMRQWVHLGRVRRITNDVEIATPYGNRLCVNSSTPVYIEMRSNALDHHKRESKLISLYVNVYYYCDEELRPKMHSVHLDSVNCDASLVIYTTITESRYFITSWLEEQVMGKSRSGICKYSLTPALDTLASIREFKQLRHELRYIECLTEDRLIGYGQSRVTIWDHRSGDILMNYDLGLDLGRNLGAVHYPSIDMEQSSMLVLYQHIKEAGKFPELHIIACELSHTTPSHRVLHVHRLPSPQFDANVMSVNTSEHLILKSCTEEEIWISLADPRLLTYVAPQGTQRFYTRHKSQIIELTPQTLTVDSVANYLLRLATYQLQHQQQHPQLQQQQQVQLKIQEQ